MVGMGKTRESAESVLEEVDDDEQRMGVEQERPQPSVVLKLLVDTAQAATRSVQLLVADWAWCPWKS